MSFTVRNIDWNCFVINMVGGFMRNQSSIDIREEEVNKRIVKHQYEPNLYHYTSIASLIGILSKKELWLGNTANMNVSGK